jgi:hypothetical protein
VGTRLGLFDTLELTAAAKYLDIPAKGRGAVIDDDFFGNTAVDTDGDGVPDAYKFDYNFYNLSLGIGFHVFATDVVLYGDYVENDDADDLDTGYVVGVKLGRAKTAGSWQMRYQYAELEADATLGVVTDSNFMGGGTDGEGHRLSGRYMLNDAWYLGATYFDGNSGVNLGNDADYQRFVLDTGCSY